MKSLNIIRTILVVTALVTALITANSAISAQPVNRMQAATLEKTGVISARGAYSLSELENKLKMQAMDAGATGHLITGVTGNNLLNGTATLYR